ncbi:hypothetical protein JCM9534A_20060 [Catenuloplanes indicus JCM 9534]
MSQTASASATVRSIGRPRSTASSTRPAKTRSSTCAADGNSRTGRAAPGRRALISYPRGGVLSEFIDHGGVPRTRRKTDGHATPPGATIVRGDSGRGARCVADRAGRPLYYVFE